MLVTILMLMMYAVRAGPSDFILLILLNKADSLQDIGDIVDSALLNSQLAYSVV